ncbi:ketopantoate reductase family protein [Methanogenium organophilum]|uniref:2-dehydropantoate 2-reductase n=1 Tax=Methanogenium organophilum TaxID=2199 RepID=A0A9X9T7Q4_METOG|nr:ketopantoate reductase family protein [Methanogenium organophilum]WAI00641.1 ketopantoate reductase family protein [Methanogenium organophilum]
MKIAVLGAGAVGLSIAARLSSLADVHAVARPRHADAVTRLGLRLTGLWGDGTYTFPCTTDLPDDEYDYILITSKATQTRDICEEFGDRFGDASVVSIQNGIGNEEIISEYTGNVIGGMIITGFEWRGDADIHISVIGGDAQFGLFPDGCDERVDTLVGMFETAGIVAVATESIRSAVWGKTIYNAALNPLGAVMGVPYGALLNPYAWEVITDIVEEAYAVADAEGITLEYPTTEVYLQYLHDVQIPSTFAHHSSMYQALSAGKRTEIDFMNGALVTKGAGHGISTPVNLLITRLIRFRETVGDS